MHGTNARVNEILTAMSVVVEEFGKLELYRQGGRAVVTNASYFASLVTSRAGVVSAYPEVRRTIVQSIALASDRLKATRKPAEIELAAKYQDIIVWKDIEQLIVEFRAKVQSRDFTTEGKLAGLMQLVQVLGEWESKFSGRTSLQALREKLQEQIDLMFMTFSTIMSEQAAALVAPESTMGGAGGPPLPAVAAAPASVAVASSMAIDPALAAKMMPWEASAGAASAPPVSDALPPPARSPLKHAAAIAARRNRSPKRMSVPGGLPPVATLAVAPVLAAAAGVPTPYAASAGDFSALSTGHSSLPTARELTFDDSTLSASVKSSPAVSAAAIESARAKQAEIKVKLDEETALTLGALKKRRQVNRLLASSDLDSGRIQEEIAALRLFCDDIRSRQASCEAYLDAQTESILALNESHREIISADLSGFQTEITAMISSLDQHNTTRAEQLTEFTAKLTQLEAKLDQVLAGEAEIAAASAASAAPVPAPAPTPAVATPVAASLAGHDGSGRGAGVKTVEVVDEKSGGCCPCWSTSTKKPAAKPAGKPTMGPDTPLLAGDA